MSSSSARQTHHRRRSHSASSPLPPCRHLASDNWRPTFKRARPSSLRSPSYKDIPVDEAADRCRGGKRIRRESTSPTSVSRGPCLFGSSPVFREDWASVPSSLPSTALPSTSDAFGLFPNRPRPTGASSHLPSPSHSTRSSVSSVSSSVVADTDVRRLRSTAFWELQRSIVESGEGLVSRMRDWEQTHATTDPKQGAFTLAHSRKRSTEWTDSIGAPFDDDDNDEDDDIQIIHADALSDGVPDTALPRHCSRRKRARSEGDMDVDDLGDDSACLGADASHICSSPLDDRSCLSSGYASDDESPGSLTYTSSTNSSRVSLPLHHSTSQGLLGRGAPSIQSPASPSEKAIAALTLVMANGAGGLNDYEAVRSLEAPLVASLDDSLVGEMWN